MSKSKVSILTKLFCICIIGYYVVTIPGAYRRYAKLGTGATTLQMADANDGRITANLLAAARATDQSGHALNMILGATLPQGIMILFAVLLMSRSIANEDKRTIAFLLIVTCAAASFPLARGFEHFKPDMADPLYVAFGMNFMGGGVTLLVAGVGNAIGRGIFRKKKAPTNRNADARRTKASEASSGKEHYGERPRQSDHAGSTTKSERRFAPEGRARTAQTVKAPSFFEDLGVAVNGLAEVLSPSSTSSAEHSGEHHDNESRSILIIVCLLLGFLLLFGIIWVKLG